MVHVPGAGLLGSGHCVIPAPFARGIAREHGLRKRSTGRTGGNWPPHRTVVMRLTYEALSSIRDPPSFV
jgi:hypothetical protein